MAGERRRAERAERRQAEWAGVVEVGEVVEHRWLSDFFDEKISSLHHARRCRA
jgi:hypothetical protein